MKAAVSTCNTYTRRRPELTPCYQIIQSEFETFASEREAEGRPLPPHVQKEFDEYLKCGIPAYGFLRLVCESCKEEKIVAFSCKKRGFCPSCCAKRTAEAATHLALNVLPVIGYRQFIITFPIPMRFWLQTNQKLYAKIHKFVIAEIHKYYIEKAKAQGVKEPTPGTISFTQRFGSALGLNIHIHVLCADGVYTRVDGRPLFRNLGAITDREVASLTFAISHKVMRYLKKQGYLDNDGEVVLNPLLDELFKEHEALSTATAASVAGRVAFGPNAGKYVTRIGKGFGYRDKIPLVKGKRCQSVNGFSVHANTHVNALARDRLDKLIQYIARGPLSNERLQLTEDHKVKLRLKTPYSDGTTHLLFTYGEFIEKLVALVPPPRIHLVRWAGVFAPNSPYRKEITLNPKIKKGFQFKDMDDKVDISNYSWSKMLDKVFKIDVTGCESCGGDLGAVCSVQERLSVERYLKHVGIDHVPPARAPPRVFHPSELFDEGCAHEEPVIYID